MPDYVIRGTVSYPFTLELHTSEDIEGLDLTMLYGLPANAIALHALAEDGLCDDDRMFIVHDTQGDCTVETIERAPATG
jgi:hypothetical protein